MTPTLKEILIEATTREIKEGSIVRLKSGGPLMTVTHTLGATARIAWFDGIYMSNPPEYITIASLEHAGKARVLAKEEEGGGLAQYDPTYNLRAAQANSMKAQGFDWVTPTQGPSKGLDMPEAWLDRSVAAAVAVALAFVCLVIWMRP